MAAIGSVVLEIGTVLGGRYRIEKLLGMGGMGAVYQAHDLELDRAIGLKIIRPDLVGNAEILARFKRELILARQVTHRNIVRIFDLNEADGLKFITMEFIEGDDLRSIFLRERKLKPQDAVEIILQVCFGLATAHSEGVIHRDLKPSNIMRETASGRVVVMDFGLARTAGSDGMTQTGLMIGTIEYMSPEQALGLELDARSDLFALGLIFYEALTGEMPFRADSAVASLVRRTTETAKALREHDATLPEGLSNIVSKCLEREPAKRYSSAGEVISDLKAWRQNAPLKYASTPSEAALAMAPTLNPTDAAKPVAVTPATGAGSKRPSTFRKRIAAAVLALCVITGGGYTAWKYLPSRSVGNHAPVSVLIADFENHTGDPVFDGTLEPMLNSALEGAAFVNGYNRGDARKIASTLANNPDGRLDEQAARLIAAKEMIGVVVTGSLSRRGNGYKITVEAMNGLSGTSIATAEVMAPNKDAVMLAIPKLAAPIRKALGDSKPESVQLAETQGSFDVSSLEAAHEYAIGMEQQFAGKWQPALTSFRKASELDPNFGRAYSGIAAVSRNIGDEDTAEKAFKLAFAHVDRMTERERFRMRGGYYFFVGNYPKCIEEYSALVSQYPADNIGHTNLAACYIRIRNMPKALEEMRRAADLTPKGVVQRCNYALLLTYTGNFAEAERQARQVLDLNPSYDAAYMTLADAQVGAGKPQDAIRTYQQLEKLVPAMASTASLGLAEIDAYSGKFKDAANRLESQAKADVQAKDGDAAAAKLLALASVQLSTGQKAEAIKSSEQAVTLANSVEVQFLAGRIFAQAGEITRASTLSKALATRQQLEPQAYSKIVEGLVALQQKEDVRAISLFSEANKTLDTWVGHFDLGRAFLQSNQFAEANSEFDICLRRRGEALELLDDGPTYQFLPPVFYYQGRVLAALQNSGSSEFLTYLSIRGESKDDPLVPDVRREIVASSK